MTAAPSLDHTAGNDVNHSHLHFITFLPQIGCKTSSLERTTWWRLPTSWSPLLPASASTSVCLPTQPSVLTVRDTDLPSTPGEQDAAAGTEGWGATGQWFCWVSPVANCAKTFSPQLLLNIGFLLHQINEWFVMNVTCFGAASWSPEKQNLIRDRCR